MGNRYQRHTLLVDARLQLLILLHLGIFFVLCIVVMIIDYYIFQELKTASVLASDIAKHSGKDADNTGYYTLLIGYVGALLALNLGFFYALSLYISHRIAGPIINIAAKLTHIEAGDLTEVITLRDGDYLKGVEQKINLLSKRLCASMSHMQEDIATLKSHPGLQAHVDLQQTLTHLETTASQYNTKHPENSHAV